MFNNMMSYLFYPVLYLDSLDVFEVVNILCDHNHLSVGTFLYNETSYK